MALRNAIMAALLDGKASGYDLARGFDASVANFWTCTPQQLYRELEKMEKQGLISAQIVEQERRPNKRLFTLTDSGRAELAANTTRKPKPIAIRDELLVQVQSLEVGDGKSVRKAVLERQQSAIHKVARYKQQRDRLVGDVPEDEFLATSDRIGPYLTLTRGIAFEEENLRWCELVLNVFNRRYWLDNN